MKPLIAIEAQRLLRKDKHGLETAAIVWLLELDKMELPFEVHLFVNQGPDTDLLRAFKQIKVLVSKPLPYLLWEQVWLPRQLAKKEYKLLHCTANTRPLLTGSVPVVLTLHDVIFFETPQQNRSLYHFLGRVYRKYIVKRSIHLCRRVFTVSDEELGKILDLFPKLKDRLRVIPNTIQHHLLQPVNSLKPEGLLLLVSPEKRKNSAAAIEAVAIALRSGIQLEKITIVGSLSAEDKQKLERLPQLGISLHRWPHLSAAELFIEYAQHKVFLFPSSRESFGLPVLEAFYSGAMVVTSEQVPSAKLIKSNRIIRAADDPIELALALMNAFELNGSLEEIPPLLLKPDALARMYLQQYQSLMKS